LTRHKICSNVQNTVPIYEMIGAQMGLGTIEKAAKLVDLLSTHPRGLSLADISRKLGFAKSSVHHMLQTLLASGYIAKDPDTKKYSLGFKFLQISSRILEGFDIREIAKRHLLKLHEKCHEAVQLYVLRNGKLVCIDKIGMPAGGLSISSFVGWTTEPHPAAAGKMLLSELSIKEILEIYPGGTLKGYGKNTITDWNELLRELEMVRKQGYAIDDEEYYEGIRCVAAPVRAGGKLVASVSVTGSIFSMGMKRMRRDFIGPVVKTGESISGELANAHI
jgi:IclR family KDG regulon transcriptional repressor